MLQELSIRNFAIIDDLQISFSRGLTILSGETGAGKSIIIQAVNLLMGERAAPQMIRTGADQAELEALFEIPAKSCAAAQLAKYEFAHQDTLVVRRIISRHKRHRVFINGHVATIQTLVAITKGLVSISGQHAHQSLLQEDQPLMILDQFGGFGVLGEKVRRDYHKLVKLVEKLQSLMALKTDQTKQTELLQFQRDEIRAAAVSTDEDKVLEEKRQRLKNAELIYQGIHTALDNLYDSQDAIIERIDATCRALEKTVHYDARLSQPANALTQTRFQIEEICDELRQQLQTIETDAQQLDSVENRLDQLAKLKRKYGGSIAKILSNLTAIENELNNIDNVSQEIQLIEKTIGNHHRKLATHCLQLSDKRKAAALKFSRQVIRELAELKMPDSRFSIALEAYKKNPKSNHFLCLKEWLLTENGIDHAKFMLSPNPGEAQKPLAAIASGGELSRVVLALKTILARKESVETVVFDEADAGIGGSVAETVGHKLALLARYHQVICITHLPQIAKFGRYHLQINKKVVKGKTFTSIAPLNTDQRLQEIARMLGGVVITPATLNHAKDLLEQTPSTDT